MLRLLLSLLNVGISVNNGGMEVEQLKQESIASHIAWTNAGKPNHGDIFNRKVKCKLAYKSCIRNNMKIEKETVTNNLHDALSNKSQNSFWKIWRNKFSNHAKPSPIIDGQSNDS